MLTIRAKRTAPGATLLEEALDSRKKRATNLPVMINNTNLGGVQRSLHNYQASVDYHQHSLRMAREMGEERWMPTDTSTVWRTPIWKWRSPRRQKALYARPCKSAIRSTVSLIR